MDRIKREMLCYFCVMAFLVLVLNQFTKNILQSWIYAWQLSTGQALDESMHWEEMLYEGISNRLILPVILILLYRCSLFIYLMAGCVITVHLFCRNRIEPGIFTLEKGIAALCAGNYDVQTEYRGEDELGRLCRSFEVLRRNLIEEKKMLWQQQDEQRKVNAAFAHDMRTPLTIIEGYTEFLLRHIPRRRVTEERILEKLGLMKEQEERLFAFSRTMGHIQQIEEIHPDRHPMKPDALWELLHTAAEELLRQTGRELKLEWKRGEELRIGQGTCYNLDKNLLREIFENLLSNAMRFAVSRVQVEICGVEGKLIITVSDDGRGFSEEALRRACDTYYTEEKNSAEHFGIGLAVCRILAAKHGGSLQLANCAEGGAAVVVMFDGIKIAENIA